MKHLKKFKIFENEFYESFDLIKDYINEFCDILDLDLYPNDTHEKIFLKTNSNGIFVWRFLNSVWEKTDELRKWEKLIFEIRMKDSFRVPNEDKIKNLINWLVERINDSEIIENKIAIKFYAYEINTWKNPILEKTFTTYDIKFDIIKRVL